VNVARRSVLSIALLASSSDLLSRQTAMGVSCRPTANASVECGTTRFENAHRTVFRELLYRWHPRLGLQVAVHGAIEKADGVFFSCTLSGTNWALAAMHHSRGGIFHSFSDVNRRWNGALTQFWCSPLHSAPINLA
jgi:hypothetical protein